MKPAVAELLIRAVIAVTHTVIGAIAEGIENRKRKKRPLEERVKEHVVITHEDLP
jgi:hypothetical protein